MIDSYVYVPVPASRVNEVLHLLVSGANSASAERVRAHANGDAATRGWTELRIRQLKAELTNSTVIWLLNACARKPGTWVSINEVITGTGRDRKYVRADLAGLTKLIKREFKTDGKWPFQSEVGSRAGFDVAAYRMSAEVAAWWKAA
jgi:hypothetical protein